MRLVAIGGGHGLQATLSAGIELGADVTAIVAVADDGGSSGRLRQAFPMLAPGDMRMALAAMSPPGPLLDLWTHRFNGSADVSGHSLGNLMLTALWQQHGVSDGMSAAASLLGAGGAVLPVALEPHHLRATSIDEGGRCEEILGQAQIAACRQRITSIETVPAVIANPAALDAIAQADVIILGPGSWFTSVIAPLLVVGVADAIKESRAHIVLIVNLAAEPGALPTESAGFGTMDYISSLASSTGGVVPSVAVVDSSADRTLQSPGAESSAAGETSACEVVRAELRSGSGACHDPRRLASTLRRWLGSHIGEEAHRRGR